MTHERNKQVKEIDCCGGPAPKGLEACCLEDADAKASGKDGCGCSDKASTSSNHNANTGCCN